MRLDIVAAAIASLLIGLPTQVLAQADEDRGKPQTFTHGESKRCESLSGAAKDQCDKEEANKGQPAEDAGTAAAGDTHFTHGESKRCESLSGAAKEQCDKEEATKTQSEPAEEASK
jgi:hypothetical protein